MVLLAALLWAVVLSVVHLADPLVVLLVVPQATLPEGLLAVAPEVVGLSEAALFVFGETREGMVRRLPSAWKILSLSSTSSDCKPKLRIEPPS